MEFPNIGNWLAFTQVLWYIYLHIAIKNIKLVSKFTLNPTCVYITKTSLYQIYLPSLTEFPTICKWLAFPGDSSPRPVLFTMVVLVDELQLLVLVPLAVLSVIRLLTLLNFQSAKYPGFEISELTWMSPKSIATTRDIWGRREGDVWVHNKAISMTLLTSSSLNSDNEESTSSTSRFSSYRFQA